MKTRNLRRLSPALVLVLTRAALAAVASVASVPCQDADPKHALSGLQPFITAEMEKAKLPGMAMAIVQNKKLLCAEGFGLRDVGAIVAPEKSIVTSVRVARAAQWAIVVETPSGSSPENLPSPSSSSRSASATSWATLLA